MNWIVSYWPWNTLKEFLESPFTTSSIGALLGALFGAWLGALAAQKIGRRDKGKEQLQTLLRNINAANVLAHNVFNGVYRLKHQYVADLVKEYGQQRMQVHTHKFRIDQGIEQPNFQHLQLELNTLDELRVSVVELKDAVLGRLPPWLRPSAIAAQLTETIGSLNWAIAERNRLLGELKSTAVTQDERIRRMFAVKDRNGDVDDTYGHLIDAIETSTNAALYFIWRLSNDLTTQGNIARTQLTRIRGKRREKVFRIAFAEAFEKGMMPSISEYEDWEKGFHEAVPRTYGRWLEKIWYEVKRRWRWFDRLLGECRRFRHYV